MEQSCSEQPGIGRFNIKLEQGKALKPFNELSEKEIEKLGRRVFAKVLQRCKKFGTKPVIGKS